MAVARSLSGDLDVRVLGVLEVHRAGHSVAIAGTRARGLLALLARSVGRPVAVTEIVRQVWGLAEAEAGKPAVRNAVQARVSSIRRVLGREALRADSGGYVLDLATSAVDAVRFETALADARRLRPIAEAGDTAEAYRRALDEWRGELAYADVRRVPVLAEAGDRLGELRLQALQESLEVLLDDGQHATAAAQLVLLTRQHPQVEEFWALRMLGLHRQGRQADAIAVYREARRVLGERFGLAPGARLRDAEALVLRGAPAAPKAYGPAYLSRPATSFFGRERDLVRALDTLRHTRMLTLTGPGGVGKTRLALEVVQALAERRGHAPARDAVVVDLVPYTGEDDLAAAVLDVLSAVALPGGATGRHGERRPLQLLGDVLRDRRLLLVLDNCEHVAGGAAELCSALVKAGPAITVLATSRQPLGVSGECVHALAPLTTRPGTGDPAELAALPAVRLFLDRARSRLPGFGMKSGEVRAVARICHRFDGIPLAIELAAVCAGELGLSEVERLLDDGLQLEDRSPGAPDRHRTPESVVAWSHRLLDRPEQRALARLSVFRGSFLLQQAMSLWTRLGEESADVPPLLESLVAKSVVQADPADGASARFRLLETIRRYAGSRLEEAGEADRAVRAHLAVYVAVAIECGDQLKGSGQAQAVRTLMLEDGNVRAALQRAVDGGLGDEAQALIGALGYLTWMRGGRVPDWQLVTRAMALPVRDTGTRVRALAWTALLGSVFGHLPEAVEFGRAAVELGQAGRHDCAADLALAHVSVGHALHRLGQRARGDAELAEASRFAAASGDPWTLGAPSMSRGLGMLTRGRIGAAEDEFLTAAEYYCRCADRWMQQRATLRRAIAREAHGDYEGAATLLAQAVELIADLGLAEVAAPAEVALARVTLLSGDVETGRRLTGELARSSSVPWLEGPAAQLAQCEAILAEVDGRTAEAARRHLDAGVRLAEVGLFAEAVDSWARVVALSRPDSPGLAAALGAAEQVASASEDPRVLETVEKMRIRG